MSRPRSLALLAVLLPALVSPALAQPVPEPPPPPAAAPAEEVARPQITLDVEALLTSPRVLPDQVGDQVWTFTPEQGRQMLMLPLTIEPGEQAATLEDPGIEVRGGRYLVWHINPEEAADAAMTRDPAGPAAAEGHSAGGLLLMDNNFDLGGRVPQNEPAAESALVGSALPADAPTFTRSLTVQPDGSLQWTMDRTLPGGVVNEQDNDYTLKLRGDRLRAKEPQRTQVQRVQPGVAGGGGNPQEAARQRREADAQYRLQAEEFRTLLERVRSAPEQFEVPMPRRVYAVYEVSSTLPQITLVGPEPLPWSLSLTQLATLRTLAAQASSTLTADQQATLSTLAPMARENHPLTHRLLALALHKSGLTPQSQPNDPLFNVLRSILQGPDEAARQIVLTDLVTTIPPTPGSTLLLRDAAKHLTPDMQLASLRGMLQGNASDPAQQREMVATVNRTLADEAGPDAGVVLRAMVDQVGELDPSQATLGSPTAAFITGVNFDSLPPKRKDQAIAYVIRDAGTQPLAAAWLNHRLLGAPDQALVRRTFELLSRATVGAGVVEPMSRSLLAAVFGDPPESPESPESPQGEHARPLDLRLTGRIPLDSTGHSVFRGLQHGDAAVRELAWRSIGNFVASTAANAGDPRAAEEVISHVLKAGLAQTPTPPQLATFFSNHRESPAATAGLVQLVIFGNNPAAVRQAARALRGSERAALPAEVQSLEPDQRADFAAGVYEALRGQAPLTVGLLADPATGELAGTFGAALAAGDLPEPAAFGEAVGTETELLNLAAGPNPRAAAGAVGALVAMAGGDEATAQELADRFAAMPDRNLQAITQAWTPAKREIYGRRLASAGGSYRLTVRFRPLEFDQAAFGPPPPGGLPATLVAKSVTVGVVDLNVEGTDAYLGNRTVGFTVPEERLALRLASPTDLANFQNPELGTLGLDRLQGPIDLLPQEDGSWRGEGQTPEGGTIEVLLEPVAL